MSFFVLLMTIVFKMKSEDFVKVTSSTSLLYQITLSRIGKSLLTMLNCF